MTATPAQVANDLSFQAQYFAKRDGDVASACRDCARLIRAFVAGERVDGRTYGGVYQRMLNMDFRHRRMPDTQIAKSINRGMLTLQKLYGQSRATGVGQ